MAKTQTIGAGRAGLFPLDDGALQDLLQSTPASPFPTIDDREAWTAAASTPLGAAIKRGALAAAEEAAKESGIRLPTLTEQLAFRRTGDRVAWQTSNQRLVHRFDVFTLAAAFTAEARWVDAAADALWALCETTTWCMPAHEEKRVPDPDDPTIDLGAAMRAQEIAEALQILGPAWDRIEPGIGARARREIDRRVFAPFLARGDWWWLSLQYDRERLNNWTAVCSGAILAAAVAALNDDSARQVRVVRKAAWSLGFFDTSFDANGSLDEGVGYWNYGMLYYVMAAERLAARTEGRLDLLADPIWGEVARFPLRVRLHGDTFPNFSDCAEVIRPDPGWLGWFGKRMTEPAMVAWAARLGGEIGDGKYPPNLSLPPALRSLFLAPKEASGSTAAASSSSLASYLPDVQWLIARSDASDDALVLAAKGGHNAENHNHNDGGSFIVHYNGEALITEMGAPTYTRQFFSSTRYENLAARSLGHSVPYVNGVEQHAGREYAANVINIETSPDLGSAVFSLDLTRLYPESAGTASIVRTLSLAPHGEDAPHFQIRLADRVEFTENGGTFALPLWTKDRAVVIERPGRATISGQRGHLIVEWDPAQASCRAEDVRFDDPRFTNSDGSPRLRRLWFDVAVVGKSAALDLLITAEPLS